MFDLSAYLPDVLFLLSLVGMGAILILSAAAHLTQRFQFFPPPSGKSWQHSLFKNLFRLFLYPLIALTYVKFEVGEETSDTLRLAFGGALLCIGIGFAFWITVQMGWRNAFGEKRGLKTDGWFRWSRNPVYVVTWIGLVGWGVIAQDTQATFLLSLWALMYLLAPIVEEPWLERKYGQEYDAYRKQVRRFI